MTEQCTVTVAADERRGGGGDFREEGGGHQEDNLPWVAQLVCVKLSSIAVVNIF